MTVRVSRRPLSPAGAYRMLSDRLSGGVVLFVGRVRPDRRPGGRVRALEYEADPTMAPTLLRMLEREARRRFAVRKIVLVHRTGRLAVGTASVLVGVAAPHRRPAFAAAQFLIERLKQDVPIWKTELRRVKGGRPSSPGADETR